MRLTLLCVLLLPVVCFAQEKDALTPPPPPPSEVPLDAVPDPQVEQVYPPKDERPMKQPPRPAVSLTERASSPKRIFVAFGGGLAASAISVVAGLGLGCSLDSLTSQFSSCNFLGLVLPIGFTFFALPTGVIIAADAVGGKGSALAAVGGFVLGAASMIPTVMIIGMLGSSGSFGSSSLFIIGATTITALLPFIGAITGYEISHAVARDDQLDIDPWASVSSSGAAAGVTFRF